MTPTRRLFTSGSFPVLEAAAVGLLRDLKTAGDPLAPLWIVVPTNLLRLHLARRVAADGAGHANLRFFTLLDLARELAEAALLAGGMMPLAEPAATALVRRLVTQHPTAYFAELADRPGLHAALLATFSDLADGEVDAHTLSEFVATTPADSHARLTALAQLYLAYRTELRRARLYEPNDLLLAAAERAAAQPPPGGQIVLYGFYDLTALQRRLVAAVTRHASAIAFVPWENSPRFAYATPTVSWWRSLEFTISALDREPPASDLARAQSRVFEGAPSRPEGATDQVPDDTLTVISAPGEGREAREVVRAVLELVRERGLRFHEIGVLLRAPEPYGALVVEALQLSGIPVYREGGRALTETRAGRALLLLLRIVQQDLARTAVIEFLTTAPVPFATLLPEGVHASPAQWDVLAAEAGIVAGREQWTARLAALARRYEARIAEPEDAPPWLASRLAELDRCRRFMDRFADDLDTIPRRGSWQAQASAWLEVFARYMERGDDVDSVRDAVAPLAQLDAVGGDASFADFAAAVAQALGTAHERAGVFGRGVFVGDIMPARGLSFRAVITPGLVERGIPRSPREDPLLLDQEREYLGERTGKQLALKQHGFDEERLLFSLMLNSAQEAAVLTFPRLDMATARERLPSFFLLQLFTAVTGARAGYRDFERWSCVRRIELSRLVPTAVAHAIDRLELQLAQAEAAVRAGDARPISGLLATAPFLRAACRAEAARWSEAGFTPYDGVLTAAAPRARLAAREWTLSARRVQSYATCPFRFFLEDLLGIEPLEEPERVQQLSGLDRGNLVHGILCDFYRRAVAEGLVPLRANQHDRALAIIGEVASTRCTEFEAEGLSGLPLLWQRDQRRVHTTVREFVANEIAAADAFVPTHFEYAFGDGDRVVHLRLPSGETVRLRGRIDRIDLAADAWGRVIDYKTGKPVPVAPDVIEPATIQLPFYLHAVRTLFPAQQWARAELYYVSDAGTTRTALEAGTPAAQEATLAAFVERVLAGIRAGYFPAGAESCQYCDFTAICGRANALFAAKAAGTGADA